MEYELTENASSPETKAQIDFCAFVRSLEELEIGRYSVDRVELIPHKTAAVVYVRKLSSLDKPTPVAIPTKDYLDAVEIGGDFDGWDDQRKAFYIGRMHARIHQRLGSQCQFSHYVAYGTRVDQIPFTETQRYGHHLDECIGRFVMDMNMWGFDVVSVNTTVVGAMTIVNLIGTPKERID